MKSLRYILPTLLFCSASYAAPQSITTLGLTIDLPYEVDEEPYKHNKNKVKLKEKGKTAGDSYLIEVVRKPQKSAAFLKDAALLNSPTNVKEEKLKGGAWRIHYMLGDGIYWYAEQRKVGKKWVQCSGYRFSTEQTEQIKAACATLK